MRVGIVGAGTMGTGIALAFAQAAMYRVVLTDIDEETAVSARGRIAAKLDGLVAKEKMDGETAAAIMGRIEAGSMDTLSGCGLITEAVREELEVKRKLFTALQAICSEDTIFVTNTSSLSITEMGLGLERPIVGMHFFNPADRLKLVEVIAGIDTPPETVAEVKRIALEIGKVPVEVNEAGGFVVNRILIPMINEAVGVLAENVASAEDIDTAMRLGANHPMGPLALADLVGLDICLAIMEVLHAEFGEDKYRPHPLLRKMVRGGRLGRKAGKGFFEYFYEGRSTICSG